MKHDPAEITTHGLKPNMSKVTIHPTAIIADGAEIGAGSKIGAYTIIGPNVKIGKANSIGSHVVIDGHTTIGDDNAIYQFASIGAPPQDLKYNGEASQVIIGSKNTIREYTTIQRGTTGGGMKTIVGNENLFMVSSHVGHDSLVGNRNVFANSVALAGHVVVTDNVILGGLVAVHQFCTLGDGALIGGGAMVTQDVPPYVIVQGDRARLIGVNTVGLKRRDFSSEEILKIKSFYRKVFFVSEHNLQDRLSAWENANQNISQNIKDLIQFIRTSKRGIVSIRMERDQKFNE